jgi:hypothetical protein
VCTRLCGDGFVAVTEACDDGIVRPSERAPCRRTPVHVARAARTARNTDGNAAARCVRKR